MNHDDMNVGDAKAGDVKLLGKPTLHALPLDEGAKHHHGFVDNIFGWAGATTVALSLAPLALQQIGIGLEQIKLQAGSACCAVIQGQAEKASILQINNFYKPLGGGESSPVYGIAGAISGALSHVPFGEKMLELEQNILNKLPFTPSDAGSKIDSSVHPLARGGVINMLAGGGLIILGHFGGNALEELEKKHALEQATKRGASAAELLEIEENAGGLSRAAKLATQAAGFTVLMPAILPGIGHSLLSLSTTLGLDKINYKDGIGEGPFSTLAAVLGKNPGACKGDVKLTDTANAVLTSQLCCIAPTVLASIPMLLTHTNTPENKLPEGINPYRKQDHDLMPNIEKLAQLTDAEIEQRIKDNAFHIADTEALQERTSGLRNVAKIGAGVLAATGTAFATNKFLNNKFDAAIQQVNDIPRTAQGYGKWNAIDGISHETSGAPYELIQFQPTDENIIANNISLPFRNDASYQRVNPDSIRLRDAKCALPQPEGGTSMSSCTPQKASNCCPNTMINAKIVDELASLAKTTKNRALLSGVAATAVGAGAYKAMEHIVDGNDVDKKHSLKHENFVLTAIQKRRASHEGRIDENSHDLLTGASK